ncbi:MAG TPA: hypothetical protein VIM11_04650 [Tepidisphaeraceae bacterium]
MHRRLFAIASAISLLLCLTTVFLWVRSYWRSDFVFYEADLPYKYEAKAPEAIWLFCSMDGSLHMIADFNGEHLHSVKKRHLQPHWRSDSLSFPTTAHALWPWISINGHFIWVRHWLIAILAAALPIIWLWQFMRRDRLNGNNECRACSYDLTANTSGVCPECGSVIDLNRVRNTVGDPLLPPPVRRGRVGRGPGLQVKQPPGNMKRMWASRDPGRG